MPVYVLEELRREISFETEIPAVILLVQKKKSNVLFVSPNTPLLTAGSCTPPLPFSSRRVRGRHGILLGRGTR